MERFAWWYFIAAIALAFTVGCSPAIARGKKPGKCAQWADIQKESRYAAFHCLLPNEDGWRCNRGEGHDGGHHVHSLEGVCISWR